MTSARKPTPQQVDLLRAVEAGQVKAHGGQGGSETYHREMPFNEYPPVTAAVERLCGRGWVVRDGEYQPGVGVSRMLLTDEGREVLRRAEST